MFDLTRRRARVAGALVAVLATAGTLAIAGCGDDDDDAQEIALVLTETGGGQVAFAGAPDSADPGLVEITLRNDGTREHEAQLFRVEGEHSVQEVIGGVIQAIQGQSFPDWLFAAGGIGPTPKGQSQTVTQAL